MNTIKTIQSLIKRVQKTQHGFTDIQKAAEEVFADHSSTETRQLAKELFLSEVHQARMLGTFLFGKLAAKSKESLTFLRKRVSLDKDWRVQEILAQAFNQYCKDIGYEKARPVIRAWLATEGLRIWTTRDYFREHPDVAIQLLSQLKEDKSDYVRKSVGNALRDISRKHKELVRAELQKWDLSKERVQQIYKLAGRFL